jgi:hypothetical protein
VRDSFIGRSRLKHRRGSGARTGFASGQNRRPCTPFVEELECRRVPAAPVVLSIDRASPVGPNTSASSVTFAVTFSEPVTGVEAANFVVATTGLSSDAPQVTGSGSDYSVTVDGIAGGDGVGLNLVDNGSIRDVDGNPLSESDVRPEFQNQILSPMPCAIRFFRDRGFRSPMRRPVFPRFFRPNGALRETNM